MAPEKMVNYFIASTGASAALVGLIFVAISLAPKEAVMPGAAPERRAVAGSTFLALINIFFISLAALDTSGNLGWTVLVLSSIGLVNSLWLGIPLFTRKRSQGRLFANIILVLLSLIIYHRRGRGPLASSDGDACRVASLLTCYTLYATL